jgi:urease accessory protein
MIEAMIVDAPLRDATFAANRAMGRIALSVTAASGQSRRARVHEAGSLRVRFPNPADAAQLEAVIVNTAGGMAGGDHFDIEVEIGAGARLCLTSAAAEKVYRSLGPDTQVGVKLTVGSGTALAWLPQETILFDRSRLRRTIDLDLAKDASVLLAEGIVFGRSAMGETVARGHLFDRWRVRVGGELVFAETTRLDGEIAQRLSEAAVAAGGAAVASVLKLPGDEDAAAAIRAMQSSFVGEVASRAGMDLRSRAWSRPTAPPCATISSRC